MDIFKEFLEVSTIHGLAYIASAKVSFFSFKISLLNHCNLVKTDQASVAWNCLSWVRRGWDPDWQVVQGVAGQTRCHHDHYPCHRRPGVPHGGCLPSKGLQYGPLP